MIETRKMRSFRLPVSARMKLRQMRLTIGKDQTALLIEGINLLWEKYARTEEAQNEKKTETA